MTNTDLHHLSRTKLMSLHNMPARMLDHLIGMIGYRDYHKEIHFSGSYMEIWRRVSHENLAIYKVSVTEFNRNCSFSTTHGTVWDIDRKYYAVSYGHNDVYETSSDNLPLQAQHSQLFTMLMKDIKTMFFPSFTATHSKAKHDSKKITQKEIG